MTDSYLTPTNPDPDFIDLNTGQKIFAAEYSIADRTFVFHFWANNFEDAEWHLRYIRQGAKLIGQVFKSEDMGGMQ